MDREPLTYAQAGVDVEAGEKAVAMMRAAVEATQGPRVLGGMVVGAGLACAGTVFQAILRNPMADPYIIGTAAGASLGAVAALLLPVATIGWLGIGTVQAFAFAGGLAAVLVVFAVARGRGGTPVVTLLLAGYAISSLLAAGVAFLLFTSGDRLAAPRRDQRPGGRRRPLRHRDPLRDGPERGTGGTRPRPAPGRGPA